MALDFYGYAKCSTCQKAKKYLAAKHALRESDITLQPPAKSLLKRAMSSGNYRIKDLLNTSGELYREFKLKDKLAGMSTDAVLDLLVKHGKLIKRPVVSDGKNITVGFKEEVFKKIWK